MIFNSLNTRLQFTVEVGIDNRISFLDMLLIVEDGKLVFDGYRKAISPADSLILIHTIQFVTREALSIDS